MFCNLPFRAKMLKENQTNFAKKKNIYSYVKPWKLPPSQIIQICSFCRMLLIALLVIPGNVCHNCVIQYNADIILFAKYGPLILPVTDGIYLETSAHKRCHYWELYCK